MANPDRTGPPSPYERIDGALDALKKIPVHVENAFIIATVEVHLTHLRDELAGPTGRYPRGSMKEGDRGELAIAITTEKDKVVMAFGYPIDWIGMDPPHAVELAQALVQRAREVIEPDLLKGRK